MSDLYEPDFGTAYYRSNDPIKNLRIRVKFGRANRAGIFSQRQQTGHGSGEGSDGAAVELSNHNGSPGAPSDTEEYIFSWQEKVFSQREVELYSDEANCFNVIEKKYHNDVRKLLEKGKPNNRMFTYVDHDRFSSGDESVQQMTTSENETPSSVAEKMANIRRRRVGAGKRARDFDGGIIPKTNIVQNETTDEARVKHHLLPAPVHTWYILADTSAKDAPADLMDEVVLCAVQLDANGVIAIKPDFTKGSSNPYVVECGAMGRDTFEYTLEHTSKSMNRQEQDRELKMYRELYHRHGEFLQACVGSEFDMPPPDCLRLLVYGEIESAWNFEYDDLYIHFFVDLPKFWCAERFQQLSWVTQTCATKVHDRDDVAYFSYPFSFELYYKNDSLKKEEKAELPRFPSILFEILSLDSWNRFRTEGYTYLSVPNIPGVYNETAHCWRPVGTALSSELRRFFIGGSPELEDPTYSAVPSTFDGSHLSKYGFQTETSGSIHVRLNVIMQSRAFMERKAKKRTLGNILDALGISAVQANIANVLDAFKKAHQKMIQARDASTQDLMKDTAEVS